MYMPVPAIHQAMMAPNGPVAVANLPGRLKMPAPIIDPTTIPIKANKDSFCSDLPVTSLSR
ncbi:msr6734 [Mesorhizobium japonicum MAFF 303099]|uniref:Msr6734 protein n=1 Tax=Mesorhizobium japonicum (strain LMG 29417 / CECT 9101 / MAFF 303099) TaxID=266835 RepID=Q988H9_RHILO|nr:msr6734 [Mesorhizobium japonicum MAFF 303099]